MFTTAVVHGLQTGEADRDGDGRVSVDELYDFVFDQVRQATTDQRPGIFADVQGALYIAQNPNPPAQVERLTLTLGPPLVRGGRTGRLVVSASNDGTTSLDLALRAQVPEAGVEGQVEPARLVLEPGMGAVAAVRVSPPQPLVGAVRCGNRRCRCRPPPPRGAAGRPRPSSTRRRCSADVACGCWGPARRSWPVAIALLLFTPGDGGSDGGGGEPGNRPPGSLLAVGGNIESSGAQDTHTATGRQGQQVLFDARECASNGTLVWTLLGPGDEPVFKDQTVCDADSPSDQTVTLPQDGDYRLIVSGSDAATGTYRVKIQSR